MGCGASASQVSVPKRPSQLLRRSSHEVDNPDPELQRLLENHGLSTQMQSLQQLGVTKPGHIADLLVTDLEEAGLSRVQIRQLQRAVARAPASTSSESPVVSPVGIRANAGDAATTPANGVTVSPKESVHAVQDAIPDPAPVVAAQFAAIPASMPSHPNGQPKPITSGDSALKEPGNIPGLDVSPAGDRFCGDDGTQMARHTGQAPPKEKTPTHQPGGKPPLYKNAFPSPKSPSVSPTQHSSPARAATDHSRIDSRTIPGSPPLPHSVGDDEDDAHAHADSNIENAAEPESTLEFDVTLLPELASRKEDLVQGYAPSPAANAPARLGAFGAGPQPQVGRGGPAPSAQMPAALRQRLEAREEELRGKRKSRPSEKSDEPRTRSPPSRRSASEGPSAQRVQARGRPASVGAVGRQMFDKNELRAAHRDLFVEAIEKYQAKIPATVDSKADGTHLPNLKPVQVYARKRPLFSDETAKRNDFDVLHVIPAKGASEQLVLHNCLFQADLRTPMVHHLRFAFDRVFSHEARDEEVYQVCAAGLVAAARAGQASTVLMFGQTGSGKTHTMRAIETLAAEDLFRDLGKNMLSISFVELRGARCFDLQVANLPELKLREVREASANFFVPESAVEVHPQSVGEACAIIQTARQRRATSVTEANDESSRSHAICTIRLLDTGGCLTLVDCAGTERRKDSANHTRERQHEGAEINASLYALKECIRFMSTRQRIPQHAFRASALTKLLARSLSRLEMSLLAVICTLAPAASDTEHTLSTLRTGAALRVKSSCGTKREILQSVSAKNHDPHPRQWSPHEVHGWLRNVENGCFADVCAALPAEFTGQMLVRLTEAHCSRLCGSPIRGQLLFELLREAMRSSNQTQP